MDNTREWQTKRLYAVVLRLMAATPGAVPDQHGYKIQGAMYDYIASGSPELAERLHDRNDAKPFTVGQLQGGKYNSRDRALHFGEGDEAHWRFTLLSDEMFSVLLHSQIQRGRLPHLRIGAVNFIVTNAIVSGGHPHSGSTTLGKLFDRYNNAPTHQLHSEIHLTFASPTVFRLGRTRYKKYQYGLFPEPRLLFSTLRKKWLKLGAPGPNDEFDTWVDEAAAPMIYDLKTAPHIVGKKTTPGFTGEMTYRFYDDKWLGFAHLLADLAFYTGVGTDTSTGMGTVYRREERRARPRR